MGWLRQALTGQNDETVAIGRLIGMWIGIVLLTGVPITIVVNLIVGSVKMETWSELLNSLTIYIPAVTLAIGGLIWGTNSTEPKQRPFDDRDGPRP